MKVPSKQLIEQLNIIHKNFTWNNKRPKIKHSTLIASYSEDGYNDIDINTKLSSIKVSWVTRLMDDNFHPWKIIPCKIFSVFGGTNIIFHTNTHLSLRCRKNVDKIPSFYRDLVYLWQNVISLKLSETTEICDEVLWNNKHITCDGNSIYDMYLINKGIVKVGDIINETGRPLNWFEAKEKFLLHDSKLLSWLGLLSCIPAIWKSKLVAEQGQSNIRSAMKKPLGITCRTTYHTLLAPLIRPATAQNTLETSLNLHDPDWKKIYMLPRLTTIESSLRSFQYKILNNILYLNDGLYKFKAVPSPLCSLCKLENESLVHLFCQCMETRKLWHQLQTWFPGPKKLPDLEPQPILLGMWRENSSDYTLINHIILLFKRYIYLSKNHQNSLHLRGFIAFIKNIETIEQHIARNRGKLDLHYCKWNALLTLI